MCNVLIRNKLKRTMEVYKNSDLTVFQEFLDTFCLQHSGPVSVTEQIPCRLLTFYLTEADIEGEVLAWTQHYLRINNCPALLAASLARAVCDEVLKWSVESYLENVDLCGDKQADDADYPSNTPSEDDCRMLGVDKYSRSVFSAVHDMCARWRDALPDDVRSATCVDISEHAVKNTRRKMEDRHVILPHLNQLFSLQDKPSDAYYAVFDGHGGCEAAIYASQHLHCNIVRHPLYHTNITKAIRDGFQQTDDAFIRKSKHEGLRSGSTCVCAFVREDKLHYAWLGDSQIVLVKDGQPVTLMQPHKPEREDEKERIQDLGGCVVWYGAWRVNGSLSVSRALGDRDFKPFVSGEPEQATYTLTGQEDYMVLACDGLWDVISYEQLAQLVREHIAQTGAGARSTAAQVLIKAACRTGSSDNITVVVVFLRDQEETVAAVKAATSDPERTAADPKQTTSDPEQANSVPEQKTSDPEQAKSVPDT